MEKLIILAGVVTHLFNFPRNSVVNIYHFRKNLNSIRYILMHIGI